MGIESRDFSEVLGTSFQYFINFSALIVLSIVRAFPETNSHHPRIIVCRTALVSVARVVACLPE